MLENNINKTLEYTSRLKDVETYQDFNIESFLHQKDLVIEQVLVDTHIKLDVRIIKDNTPYNDDEETKTNEGKIIRIKVHESMTNNINIVNIVGCTIKLNNLRNDSATIHGLNFLEVTATDVSISENKVENFVRSSVTKTDRRLIKLNLFKTFNCDKFLESNELKIISIYPQRPEEARFLIMITDDMSDDDKSNVGKTFTIKVLLPSPRDIPIDLLAKPITINQNNLKGNISGTVIKNNQLLITADMFSIEDDGLTYNIGTLEMNQEQSSPQTEYLSD